MDFKKTLFYFCFIHTSWVRVGAGCEVGCVDPSRVVNFSRVVNNRGGVNFSVVVNCRGRGCS